MKYTPHEYQERAYEWIIEHPRCALFLDMGMGKTVTTLTAVRDLLDCFEISRVLVIAPKRVAEDTWSRESEKWDHLNGLRISKVLGTAKQRKAAAEADADLYVINRENVVWLCAYTRWKYDMVVIDELSSFKSPSAKRFKALRKQIVKANRVVGLTGTPAPNGYMDLWPEIYLLDRGERLGRTIGEYRSSYFHNVSRDRTYSIWKEVPGAQKKIDRKLSDICMSMTADDYLKMPKRLDNFIPVRLSDRESELYRELEREAYIEFEDAEITAFSAAALSGKLLQLANGFLYDADGKSVRIHSRKIEALKEIVENNPYDPILIFYNFKADLEVLKAAFPEIRVLNTSNDISDWNAGRVHLMTAHPASIGHGLNIQEGGHIIVWYGLNWSLELYQQANARLYRQGQRSDTVIIHHLVAEGTIDESLVTALKRKAVTQDGLIKALKERRKNEKRSERSD